MTDEIELLKKEYEESELLRFNLKSFATVDHWNDPPGYCTIVQSLISGKYFEIFEVGGLVPQFTEVERVEETKVVVSWLPV